MKSHIEPLTLLTASSDPSVATSRFSERSGKEVIFRPLTASDVVLLTEFLINLSSESRRFSTYDGYDSGAAQGFCDAIARYDKFRMVAIVDERIVALFEFAFWISDFDKERFHSYGIELYDNSDVRFGPCIADDYQNQGLGTQLMERMVCIARQFGKNRIILWGGVISDNTRAIRFYQKNGFQMQGSFTSESGIISIDGIMSL